LLPKTNTDPYKRTENVRGRVRVPVFIQVAIDILRSFFGQ